VLPPELGYGRAGAPVAGIPPQATLHYEVEVVAVTPIAVDDPRNLPEEGRMRLPTGVEYVDLIVGEGDSPAAGGRVLLHWRGALEDGTVFGDSRREGKPLNVVFSGGELIPGVEDALADMRVGGKRRMRVPPERAYGRDGSGDLIPADATLFFDVELLEVMRPRPR
jgi:peptidylprolyl isomerase